MKKSLYHSFKNQQYPLLLRRPLPPKLPKLPLVKKRVRIAHAGTARVPQKAHRKLDSDESALVKIDQSVSQPHKTASVQNVGLDYEHEVPQRVINIFPQTHGVRRLHWKVPKSATGSMFIPRCLSASSRVFRKTLSQIKKARKASKRESKQDEDLTKKPFSNTLILSEELSKPSPPSYSRLLTSRLKPSGTKFRPAPKIPHYIQEPPLFRDVKETVLSPISSATSVIPEPQWSERPLPRTTIGKVVQLNTGVLPPAQSLPTPVLPRKPPRQIMLENAVTGKIEIQKAPDIPLRPVRKIDPDAHVLRGEGFKTIGATRSETTQALTTLAIINCQIYGRNALNLKGFFLSQCPDLTSVAFQLVYLNLSYNDLRQFPVEVLDLQNLQVLKLRNNPIREIPTEIRQLKYLRKFSIAFNYITELPPGLFCLMYLEELDISYNEIENIPNDIQRLRSLEKLTADGTEIAAFPPGILKLDLVKLQFENTFTLPYFWLENCLNNPPRLTHICSLFIVKNNLHEILDYDPDVVQKYLISTSDCDWCHGPRFGEGFRIIRSCNIFGVSQVPIMFHVCSPSCYQEIRESSFILEGFPSRKIVLNMDWVKENKASNVSFYL